MTAVREPTSIIEMAERVRLAHRHIFDRAGSYPEDAFLTAGGILDLLPDCDFYEINEGVAKAADGMFESLFEGRNTDELTLDKDCRLPSKVCAFWAPGTNIQFAGREEELPFMYFAQEEPDGVFVYLVSPYFGGLLQGGYKLEVEGGLVGPTDGSEEDMHVRATHVLTVAAMCSLLNQPGFTKRDSVGSRQERRAATRSGGYATDAWHKVTWNIGEAVKAKLQSDDPVRCMPLHYTRGHWRKAQEGWINTSQRKDGHWYQWIEGFWSGHPAFGIKKSYHAPKMGKSA